MDRRASETKPVRERRPAERIAQRLVEALELVAMPGPPSSRRNWTSGVNADGSLDVSMRRLRLDVHLLETLVVVRVFDRGEEWMTAVLHLSAQERGTRCDIPLCSPVDSEEVRELLRQLDRATDGLVRRGAALGWGRGDLNAAAMVTLLGMTTEEIDAVRKQRGGERDPVISIRF